jgi:hypothetical protein
MCIGQCGADRFRGKLRRGRGGQAAKEFADWRAACSDEIGVGHGLRNWRIGEALTKRHQKTSTKAQTNPKQED